MKKKVNTKKLPKNIVTFSVVSAVSVVITIVGLKSFDLALNGICPSSTISAAVYTAAAPVPTNTFSVEPLLILEPTAQTPELKSEI